MQTITGVEPAPVTASPRGSSWPRRVAGVLGHEWTLATLGGVLLAVLFTWPTMKHPFSTIPMDVGDPPLQAWQVAWVGHAVLHDPLNLWNANAFFPEKSTLAYSDSLLGYAPFAFLGDGFDATIFRYNVLFVFAHALAFIGAYALVRQLGAGRVGGIVAGLAFAYAPWRAGHAGHLNLLSTGGIPLALAMLARGHDFRLYRGRADDDGPRRRRRRRFRPGWALAGWLTALWQISLGFGLGVPFGYVLLFGGVIATAWFGLTWLFRRERPPFPRRLLIADLIGGAVLAAATVAMALPYLRVAEQIPGARRTEDNIDQFSVPLRGLFTAPTGSWLWGEKHAAVRDAVGGGESAILPGFFLLALAFAGTYYSVWRPRQRFFLAAGVVLSVILEMGTHFGDGDPGYLTLFRTLPGWDAMRTPGRLVVWTILLLGILAAGFLTALTRRAAELRAEERARGRRAGLSVALGLTAFALLAPVAIEGISRIENADIWEQPQAMRNLPGPALVLPMEGWLENNVLAWSTDGFPQMANGTSGVPPESQSVTREVSKAFPDAASVAYLRDIGIKTVLWHAGFGPGSAWNDAPLRPLDGLNVTKEQVGADWVFHLN